MDNPVDLKSGEYTASILPFWAELCSFKHLPTDTEFIWQADKSVWPRHAPVLFPFVGRLKNFEYSYDGNLHTIEQHGFARDLMFEVIEQTENCAILELKDNNHTWQRYPFRFSFKVKYTLVGNKLTMSFDVINLGLTPMPVSFGGHPAFNISEPNDTIIVFEKDRNPLSWMLDENFISNRKKQVTDGNSHILVNEDTFSKDALIFKYLKSDWVKLQFKSTGRSIKVNFEGWPYLGIWAKHGANFICIEPWQGIADLVDFEGDVSQKEGILMLPANERIEKSFDMEVNI